MASMDDQQFEVEELKENWAEWNQFAKSQQGVGFYHLSQYSKLIEETYGYEAVGFILKKGGQIQAVLPASFSKSILFGKKLVSQPFSEYGGILSGAIEENGYSVLLRYVKEYCLRRGIPNLEIHGNLGLPDDIKDGYFLAANPYRYAVLKLLADPESMRKMVFDYQIRKALNKAERSAVRGFQDSSPEIIKEKFWPLFLRSMKRLGSPPHPLNYFMRLQKYYPENLKVFWAEVQGKLVSALLGFAVGKRIQITNIVSDESHWELRPNDFVHWEFIKWGCENGYEEFDFGSARYEGQVKYKKKWGAEFNDCGYYYLSTDNKGVRTFNSSSDTMALFSQLWSRVMPLAVTPLIGPVIRKHLVR
jgi:serine/alanine adding enzyme